MSTAHIRNGGQRPPPPRGRRPGDRRVVELEGLEGSISLAALLEALHRAGHRLPVHVAFYITHEIARALRRLHDSVDEEGHSLARVHGSVNGQNVLLLRSGRVRLVARGPLRTHGDRHVDLYMLGQAAWEMLVGWPHDGSLTRTPVAPSSLRPGLPNTVDAVVLRALERSPRRRYPSAGSLAGDTARFLATRPDPRRGLRLLLHQVLAGNGSGDPTGVTRQTRVPWRNGSGALPALPPPPPLRAVPSRTTISVSVPLPAPLPEPIPETTRVATVATYTLRARELLQRPWLSKLGVLLFQTVVAAVLAGLALLALGMVHRSEPPPPPAARGTVIVPMERPLIQPPPVIIHVDRSRRHR